MKQIKLFEKTNTNQGSRVALIVVYVTMSLLVVGMLFYFQQLMTHARDQAIGHLSDQTKNAAEEVQLEVNRLEDIGAAISLQFYNVSLEKDKESAHAQLIESIKLYMTKDHFHILRAGIYEPDGHLTTLKMNQDGATHMASEMLNPSEMKRGSLFWWEIDQTECVLIYPLKSGSKKISYLELVFDTNKIMAGFIEFKSQPGNGRIWWLDQYGMPSPETFESDKELSLEIHLPLMSMLNQLQSGVIETQCPWHEDHKAYTALAPVFIGDHDMAILSSMDTSKITGSQIRFAIILAALFSFLLILAMSVLKLNISQRKTALQKLADEKAVIEGMFHSIDDLIFQQDLQGVYTDCNQSFANFVGLTPQEIRGSNDAVLGIPDDQIPISESDRLVLRRARRLASEVWMKRQNGKEELVDLHKHPLQHIDGEVYGVIGIGRVKTDQWQSEQNLLKLKEELEEANENMEEALTRANEFSSEADSANKAKSEFLANMSHEIRTPLGAVIGLTDLLAQTDCTGKQLKYLNKLDNSAHSLLGIINDILDFSKIEAGKMTFEIAPFHLGEVISQVTEMFSERVMSRNLFFVNKRDDVPELLLGDPVRLRQILVNLLGNSLKFTEKGGIVLTVTGGTKMGDKVFLVFSVKDTGIGIPADKIGNLFSSFSQADTSTTRKFGGTGLGLSISQQLVELMGGNIWVESILGEGTTFHFSLPFEEMDEETGVNFMDEMFSEDNMVSSKPGMPLEGLSILLVDDNEINREVISEILIQRGAQVALAVNGSEGVDRVKADFFNIVLMDMQMPVMDGPTATEKIRLKRDKETLPILALTANAQAEDKALCLKAGMNDYMAKPVDPAALVDKILALAKNQIRNESPKKASDNTPQKNIPAIQESDPRIPGIHLPEVMRRLNNNKELLIKLLKMFLAQHTNDIALINDALAAGDGPQAIHLTHALKGTAGNLSANTVYQITSEFETTLRNTDSLPHSTPDSLVEAMAELITTMKKLLNVKPDEKQQATIPPQQVDRKQILQSLHLLKKLIEENDVSTEDQFTNDRAQIESLVTSATVEELAQALMIFDFVKADKLTSCLIEELTITV